jgi:acetyl esterase/lipase
MWRTNKDMFWGWAIILPMFVSLRSSLTLSIRGLVQQSLVPPVHRYERIWVREASPRVHYEFYSSSSGKNESRPLLVFVHGGAWKTGDSRAHYQAPFLAFLLRNGVDVISCNYRKTKWPDPLADIVETFRQIEAAWPERQIIFCGASAGGHLATLAYYYNQFGRNTEQSVVCKSDSRDTASESGRKTEVNTKSESTTAETKSEQFDTELRKRHRILLFYPALDVFNQLKVRQPLLFKDRTILGRPTPPYTLLSRFFERFVASPELMPNAEFPWASPLQLFGAAPRDTWTTWPPTLVVHGVNDPITMYNASQFYVDELNRLSEPFAVEEPVPVLKHRIRPVRGSHNFDIPDCPQTLDVYEEVLAWIRGP